MPNTTVGTVQVVLVANDDRFSKGIGSAQRELKAFASAVGQSASGIPVLGNALSAIASPAGILASGLAAVAVGAGALVKSGFALASHLDDIADSTGLAASEVLHLERAAIAAGVSFQPLEMAVTKSNKLVGEAARGSESAAKTLASLGLSVRDLEGKSSFERFKLLGTAVGHVGDRAERTALELEVFGKSTAKLDGLITDLAGKLGEAGDGISSSAKTINDNVASVERLGIAWETAKSKMAEYGLAAAGWLSRTLAPEEPDYVAKIEARIAELKRGGRGAIGRQGELRELERKLQLAREELAAQAKDKAELSAMITMQRGHESAAADHAARKPATDTAESSAWEELRKKADQYRTSIAQLNTELERNRVAGLKDYERADAEHAARKRQIDDARALLGNTKEVAAATLASDRQYQSDTDKVWSDGLDRRLKQAKKWWDDLIEAGKEAQKKIQQDQAARDKLFASISSRPPPVAPSDSTPWEPALRQGQKDLDDAQGRLSLAGASDTEADRIRRTKEIEDQLYNDLYNPALAPDDQRVRYEAAVAAKIQIIDEQAAETKRRREMMNRTAQLSATSDMLTNMATLTEGAGKNNEAAFYATKAFSMAAAEVNAWIAYSNALAQGSNFGGPLSVSFAQGLAATALAAGQVAVVNIAAQEYGGGRASGGKFERGKFYEVNENGPELARIDGRTYMMAGGANGFITPLTSNQQRPNGAGVTVNVHNSTDGQARVQQSQGADGSTMIDVIIERAAGAVAGQIRSGTGLVGGALRSTFPQLNRAIGAPR